MALESTPDFRFFVCDVVPRWTLENLNLFAFRVQNPPTQKTIVGDSVVLCELN